MRSASLLYAGLLARIATTCLAGPIISSPISDRDVDASSPPPIQATTSLNSRTPPMTEQRFPLSPRAQSRYAVPGSRVYIMIAIGASTITSSDIISITDLLNGAFRQVNQLSRSIGWNALLINGVFRFGSGPQIMVWNANNHQVTLMTLELTLEAVFRYMRETWDYGVAEFDIFDGANQVGSGYLNMLMARRAEPPSPRSAIDGAGTHELERRAGNGPHRFNAYGTNVYILIGITTQLFDQAGIDKLWAMLVAAWDQADRLGRQQGAEALVRGGFFMFGLIPKINIWNANNHQVTYQSLAAAIGSVMQYMHDNNIYGAADFAIFDGENKVGEGVVSGSD